MDWGGVTVAQLREALVKKGSDTAALDQILSQIGEDDIVHAEVGGKRLRGGESFDALGDESQQKKLCATEDSTIVLECEHSKAGLIIGKKAATINMLQEKSGAFVKVATWDGTSATRAVQIRGSEDKIQVAKKMICELLGVDEGSVPILPSEAFVNGQPNKQPSFTISSRSSVRTSRTFLVPTENVGSVIGKGGAFLQSVKDDSRASVIVEKTCLAGTTFRPVVIAGTIQECAHAEMLLSEKLMSTGASMLPMNSVVSGTMPMGGQQLPSSAFGSAQLGGAAFAGVGVGAAATHGINSFPQQQMHRY